MDSPGSGEDGLLASARRVGTSLLGLLQTRVEIFSVELREEKLRAINLLLWLAVALSLAVAGILLSLGILGLFLWRQFGYAGVIGLALVTLAGSAGVLWWIRRRIVRGPEPFATTIAEIGKDIECLHPRN